VFHLFTVRSVLLGFVFALAAWLGTRPNLIRGLENWMLDGCFQWRGPRPTQANVVIIGLDEPSLDALEKPQLYLSPELAQVIAYAKRQGAAAIGVDLIIPKSLSANPDLQRKGPGDATAMGKAVVEAGNVVLARWRMGETWLEPLWQWQLKHASQPDDTDFGFVNITEDGDHFLRRQQVFAKADHEAVMHLALATYVRASGAQVEWKDDTLWVDGTAVPLDGEQKLRVNYVGPPGSFHLVPFQRVLEAAQGTGPPLERNLSGAIVLLGSTALSQKDYHATPFSNNYFHNGELMSGSEFHANVIATLIDRAYIQSWPWLTPVLLLLFGPLLATIFSRLNLEAGLAVALAHHFAWKGVSLAAFRYADCQVEMIPMLTLGFLAYAGTFALRWRRLRNMLGVVQSEAIARVLEAGPERLDLRGEERTFTVLFADIRNFTAFSEGRTPHEVVALLNAYFSAVGPVIEAHGGTINKYLGDGLMVFFGAPEPRADHALQGVRAAVAMVHRVHELKETWAKLGCPGLRIGVGVHTGKVVVGTVGSKRRLEYTAIGDTVNAAARIESENKPLATEILISAETYMALPQEEQKRLPGAGEPKLVKVKGKEQPLLLYAITVA
jgi:adenylate cyclase